MTKMSQGQDGDLFSLFFSFPSVGEFETGKPSLQHTAWFGMGAHTEAQTRDEKN